MWDKKSVVWRFSYPHTFSDFVFVFSCLVLTADRGHGDIVSYCWEAIVVNLTVDAKYCMCSDTSEVRVLTLTNFTSKHLNLEQIKPKAGYLILLEWSWLKICRLHYHCTVLKGKLLSRRQPLYILSMVSNPTCNLDVCADSLACYVIRLFIKWLDIN